MADKRTNDSPAFTVLGLGAALPPNCMMQSEAWNLAQQACGASDDQARALHVLYRRAGVRTRYTVFPHRDVLEWARLHDQPAPGDEGGVAELIQAGLTTEERMHLYERHALPLASSAAQQALAESSVRAGEITHLITVSCTGFAAPGVDIGLIRQLGLPPTVERVQVGFMGCHGAINGLRVARALAASDPAARILLCAVELCSIHFQVKMDPKQVGNAIFGDGAAALVGGAAAAERGWQAAALGSYLMPHSTDAMSWTIRDFGFEMFLSPRVPDLIKQGLRGWLEPWLERQGYKLHEIGSWAVHPGGPRILSAVGESLQLSAEALQVSRDVLAQCGNMSSPTVLFILQRLMAQAAPRPCVMLAFGPGVMIEAALLT